MCNDYSITNVIKTKKEINMKEKLLIFFTILSMQTGMAQTNVLDSYIQEGFKNNSALKEKNFNLEKANAALSESWGLFFPSVDLKSDYTWSKGGRKIDLPLGDLMNPVYSTLNQLTSSTTFPQIQNQKVNFLPNDYQDTKLILTLPIINTDVWLNNRIKSESINQYESEVISYKRELVKEIKIAYFNYLKSLKAVEIYSNADSLLNDSYKVTESLVKNNVVLKSNLLKLKAEISNNQVDLSNAKNSSEITKSYFNFLLNKPFNSPIEIDSKLMDSDLKTIQSLPVENKMTWTELNQLKSGIQQLEYLSAMKYGEFMPSLAFFYQAGFQGNQYKFNSDQRYDLYGLTLSWNLFNGLQTKNRIQQADIEISKLESKLDETQRQLSLNLLSVSKNLNTAIKKLESSKIGLEYSQEYYRQTKLQYQQGQSILIELTQSILGYTNSQLSYQISLMDVLIKQAETERAFESYQLF